MFIGQINERFAIIKSMVPPKYASLDLFSEGE
jgi:hypothetical protein